MKHSMSRRWTAVAAVAGLAILTGCGSSNSANNGFGNGNPYGGINPGLGVGGCIPITSQIGFTGTNNYFDAYNIRAGQIPGGQAFGMMTASAGAAGGPYQRQGSDGTISMNITPAGMGIGYPGYNTGYPGYNTGYNVGYQPGNSSATITGFLALSQLVIADIMNRFPSPYGGGYQYPYAQPGAYPYVQPGAYPYPQPGAYPQVGTTTCVSGISMDLGHKDYLIYGGHVYLYMNNTQHGYVVYF